MPMPLKFDDARTEKFLGQLHNALLKFSDANSSGSALPIQWLDKVGFEHFLAQMVDYLNACQDLPTQESRQASQSFQMAKEAFVGSLEAFGLLDLEQFLVPSRHGALPRVGLWSDEARGKPKAIDVTENIINTLPLGVVVENLHALVEDAMLDPKRVGRSQLFRQVEGEAVWPYLRELWVLASVEFTKKIADLANSGKIEIKAVVPEGLSLSDQRICAKHELAVLAKGLTASAFNDVKAYTKESHTQDCSEQWSVMPVYGVPSIKSYVKDSPASDNADLFLRLLLANGARRTGEQKRGLSTEDLPERVSPEPDLGRGRSSSFSLRAM